MSRFLILLSVFGLIGCTEERTEISNEVSVDSEITLDRTASDEHVTVFIHHPYYRPKSEEREHDGDLIDAGLHKLNIGLLRVTGGLGHNGYTTQISYSDLPVWFAFIASLHEEGALHYYRDYGLDDLGFGLVPLHQIRIEQADATDS